MATTTKKFDAKYIIPIGLFLGALWSGYRAIRSMHSGSTNPTPDGSVGTDSTINVGWFNTAGGWFCVILLGFAIITFIMMRRDK